MTEGSHIQIDLPEDLYRQLERMAVPFEDTGPVDVIRRLVAASPYASSKRSSRATHDGFLISLVKGGLVAAGDELLYQRRDGRSFTTTVTANGWIELGNGQVVRSPSAAIMALVGVTHNGFKAWRHVKSGKKLEELRAEISLE